MHSFRDTNFSDLWTTPGPSGSDSWGFISLYNTLGEARYEDSGHMLMV